MIFLQFIECTSGESEKKKDIWGCLVILMMGTLAGIAVYLAKPYINLIFSYIVNGLELMTSGLPLEELTLAMNNYQYEMIQQLQDVFNQTSLKIALFPIYLLPVFLMVLFVRIKRAKLLIATCIIEMAITSAIFTEARIGFLLTLIIFLLVSLFIPLGSGAYFKFVKYAFYIPTIWEVKDKKKRSYTKIVLKILAISIFGIIFALLFNLLLPYLSIAVSFLVYLSAVILVWINQPKNLTAVIIRKIIAYGIVAAAVLLNNNSFQKGVLSSVLAFVSVFFAIERVITLIKELAKRVENESVLFLIDEVNSYEDLLSQCKEIPIELADKVSEEVLIRQIIINHKLGLVSEVQQLIEVYKSRQLKKEMRIIQGIEYQITYSSDNTISAEEVEKILEDIFLKENDGLDYIPLNREYAYVLYLLDKDFDKIIDLLNQHWLLLNDEMKYILYYSFIRQGRNGEAEAVKREITEFERIRENIETGKAELMISENVENAP